MTEAAALVKLKYAESDARSFASVLQDLGGVKPRDLVLVSSPTLDRFEDGLQRVRQMVAAPREMDERREFVFYYSGHSDDDGLILGLGPCPLGGAAKGDQRHPGRREGGHPRLLLLRVTDARKGRPGAARVPLRRFVRHDRSCLPHLGVRGGGGPGIGQDRFLVLHPLPGLRASRRRGHKGGRDGDPQRGVHVRLPGDACLHRKDAVRASASRIRHQPVRFGRPCSH